MYIGARYLPAAAAAAGPAGRSRPTPSGRGGAGNGVISLTHLAAGMNRDPGAVWAVLDHPKQGVDRCHV